MRAVRSRMGVRHFCELTCWKLARALQEEVFRITSKTVFERNRDLRDKLRDAAGSARRTIAEAIELGTGFGHFHHTAYNIAATYAALHEPDEAVNWAEAAADGGFPCYPCFARDPNLDLLRGFPRFVDLLSQLHKQWRHFQHIPKARTVGAWRSGRSVGFAER